MNDREPTPPSVDVSPPALRSQPRSDAPGTALLARRALRWVFAVVAVLAIVGGLAAIKGAQIASLIGFGKKAAEAGPPPEAVGTHRAEKQDWEGTLEAIGSIASSKGVTVSTEVPGTITRIGAESGAIVKPGQVLVELDTSVERAQLASAIARKELATTTVTRTAGLAQRGAVTTAQLDNDQAQLKSVTADVAALQAQIARKTIRAPFAGKLGIRTVNLGQYLNPGTPVTALESIDSIYVDFTLPQQHLAEVKVGMPVRLKLESAGGSERRGYRRRGHPRRDRAIDRPHDPHVKLRAAVPDDRPRSCGRACSSTSPSSSPSRPRR